MDEEFARGERQGAELERWTLAHSRFVRCLPHAVFSNARSIALEPAGDGRTRAMAS
jgi:hypothetical protein